MGRSTPRQDVMGVTNYVYGSLFVFASLAKMKRRREERIRQRAELAVKKLNVLKSLRHETQQVQKVYVLRSRQNVAIARVVVRLPIETKAFLLLLLLRALLVLSSSTSSSRPTISHPTRHQRRYSSTSARNKEAPTAPTLRDTSIPLVTIRMLVGSMLTWAGTEQAMRLGTFAFFVDRRKYFLWRCDSCHTINSERAVCRTCSAPKNTLQIECTASSPYLKFKHLPRRLHTEHFEKAVLEHSGLRVVQTYILRDHKVLCCFEDGVAADKCLNVLGGGCFWYQGKRIEVMPSRSGHREAAAIEKQKLQTSLEGPMHGHTEEHEDIVKAAEMLKAAFSAPSITDPRYPVMQIRGLPKSLFNLVLVNHNDVKSYISDLCGVAPCSARRMNYSTLIPPTVQLEFDNMRKAKSAFSALSSTTEIKLVVRWVDRGMGVPQGAPVSGGMTAVIHECQAEEVRSLKRPEERVRSNMPEKSISVEHPHEAIHLVCMKAPLVGRCLKDPVEPKLPSQDEDGPRYKEWLDERGKPLYNAWTWNHELPYDAPNSLKIVRDILAKGHVFNDRTLSALITYTARQWSEEIGRHNYRYLKIPVPVVEDLVAAFLTALAHDRNSLIGLRSYCSLFTALRDVSPTRWLHVYIRFRQMVETELERTSVPTSGVDKTGTRYVCKYTYRKAVNTNRSYEQKKIRVTDHISKVYEKLLSASCRRHGLSRTRNRKVWDTFLPIFPSMLVRDFESLGFEPTEKHKYYLFRAYADLGDFDRASRMIEWTYSSIPNHVWKVPCSTQVTATLANATRNDAHLTEYLNLLQAKEIEPCYYTLRNLAFVTKNWWYDPSPEYSLVFRRAADELTPQTPNPAKHLVFSSSKPCMLGADTSLIPTSRSPRYIK
eukprot:TRINITY_DN6149_c0_g2_i1.p1 TRINITY_DN6149_c0_g2~~TRINITY_DN6149_c0_g2_i1.p1  ORF type:complete len:882 (+),score=160.06 TRINITY_DN6149_c0_g2_i1:965-3610(+)